MRTLELRLNDTKIGIWQDDANDPSFRRDIFLPLIRRMRARGWKVTPDPNTLKNYRCISPNHKLGRKGDLRAHIEISGRQCSVEFWSVSARRENPLGPKYDFDKFERMSYLDRQRFLLERRKICAWLTSIADVTEHEGTQRKDFRLANDFISAQYANSWHSDKTLGRPICTQSRNAKSADGETIEHASTVWFRGRDGRWRRGTAYYNINNMWWVVQNKFEFRNMAAFELHCRQPLNLRDKRHERARRLRLESEISKAIHASNYVRAEALTRILFGDQAPHFIWSRKRDAYYAPLSSGYSSNILHAGRYSRSEAEAECRRVPHILEMVCPDGERIRFDGEAA